MVNVYEAIHGLKKSLADVRDGRWKAEMELRSAQSTIELLRKKEKEMMVGEGSKEQVCALSCCECMCITLTHTCGSGGCLSHETRIGFMSHIQLYDWFYVKRTNNICNA